MKNEFKIIVSMKRFIFSLNDFLDNFPKSEKELVDRFKRTSFECLELIYLANNKDDREDLQKQIMSKISMLDFYLEYSFNKKYISVKQAEKKSNELNVIEKLLYGWIKSGK
jgi:hypothetical protein